MYQFKLKLQIKVFTLYFIIVTDNIEPSSSYSSNNTNNSTFLKKSNPSVNKSFKTMDIAENNKVSSSPSEVKFITNY